MTRDTLGSATPYDAATLRILRAEFDRCSAWLNEALRHGGGLHDLDSLWSLIAAKRAHLWPLPNSAGVTYVDAYPHGRVMQIWLVGGVLDEILAQLPVIEQWSIEQGCTHLAMDGRLGWRRALRKAGWDHETIMMRRRIQ